MSKDVALAAAPAGATTPDPSVLLAEEHLRVLAELREIGMDMARILKRRAEIDLQSAETLAGHASSDAAYLQAPPVPGPMRDPATAFARISRAVRLTLALEARTAEALRALRAGLPLHTETSQTQTSQTGNGQAQASGAPADLLADDTQDSGEFKAADVARAERLSEHETPENLAGRAPPEVVESVCANLLLAVDRARWAGEGCAGEKAALAQLSLAAEANRIRLVQWPGAHSEKPEPVFPRTPPPTTPPPSAAPPTRGRTGPGSRC